MPELPDVSLIRSVERKRVGESARLLSRAESAGQLTRVRRGSYAESALWRSLTPEDQHAIKMIAAADAAIGRPVFSHESAAVMWRFPIVGGLPGRPQITVAPGSGQRSNDSVVRHEAALPTGVIVDLGTLRITNVERTLVDYAASRSFLSGACAAEFLLNSKLTNHERIDDAITSRRPFRGSRKVEAVARFATSLSGSANETLCRVAFHVLGFPQPLQQKRYVGPRGERYVVDFYWPDYDIIGESDGRVKYEDPTYLAGRTPQQALWDEKLREDALRSQCSGFVRLTWDDAWNRAGLVSKLTRVGIPRHR